MKFKSTIILLTLVGVTIGFTGSIFADDDNHYLPSWDELTRSGVATVDNQKYSGECGSCHMAYPAGLLPSSSWEKLMSSLDNHFDESAELASEERTEILNYLLNNAAERVNYALSKKMVNNIKGEVPLRISQLPYFLHEHDEIPKRLVTENADVGSFSNCNACHSKAEQGLFNEHDVIIPNYGKFDD